MVSIFISPNYSILDIFFLPNSILDLTKKKTILYSSTQTRHTFSEMSKSVWLTGLMRLTPRCGPFH